MRALVSWSRFVLPYRDGQHARLSECEFQAAVDLALRDFNRPDHLRTNPLVTSSMVERSLANAPNLPTTHLLRTLIRDTVTEIGRNPKHRRFQQVLHLTYLEPQSKQRVAADALYLSWGSYRHYLREARNLLAATLWERECSLRSSPTQTSLLMRLSLLTAGIVTSVALILAIGMHHAISNDRGNARPSSNINLVVLPFLELPRQANDIYLSEAITRSLISSLGQLHGIRIIADIPMSLKTGEITDKHSIRQALPINGVIEGDIEHISGSVRVNVELINANDAEVCWSHQITMRQREFLKLEDDLERTVAVTLEDPSIQKNVTLNCG